MMEMFCPRKESLGHGFWYRLSITTALAIIGILPVSGLMAAEGEAAGVGTSVSSIPATAAGSSSAMDLLLSTWVGPGDVIRIKAFPDTGSFISGNYVIIDGGFVMLPILGLVQVTNSSISGVTAHLTNGYAKYLAYPAIQIEPLIRLSMLGGFLRPGMYLVNPLHPFSSALSAAGGTVRDDGLKLLRWERDGQVLATNLTSEVEGKKSLWALGFKSGDQVCVTLRFRRDGLTVASFFVTTFIASATLAVTLILLNRP